MDDIGSLVFFVKSITFVVMSVAANIVCALGALLQAFRASKPLRREAIAAGDRGVDARFFAVAGLASLLVGVVPNAAEFRAVLVVLLLLPGSAGEWCTAMLHDNAVGPLCGFGRDLLFDRTLPFLRGARAAAVLAYLPSGHAELWRAVRSGLSPADLAGYEAKLADDLIRINAEQRSRRSDELMRFKNAMDASAGGGRSPPPLQQRASSGLGRRKAPAKTRQTMGTRDFSALLSKGGL